MGKVTEYAIAMSIIGKLDKTFLNATKSAKKEMGLLSTESGRAMLKIAAGATAAASAMIVVGKKLYDIGAEFDNAQDKIRIGTGATGEALEILMNNAKAVYSQVPATIDDASTVISDYNTRLGLTGDALTKLSTQAIQVSQAFDEDVSTVVENSSKVFKNFNIAEDEMADSMDYAFKVSQSTGIGFTSLLSTMQTGGAQLQALGFGFKESATLLGQFEKAGLDTSTMLMGLKTTAQQAIKGGFKNTSDALDNYVNQIENAKSDTEALALANKYFGSRGGATFVKAIKNGTLNVKELQKELESSDESISKMSNDTYDYAERFQMFKNRLSVALQPVANTVFEQVGILAEKLFPVLENDLLPLIKTIQPIIEAIAPIVAETLNQAISLLTALAKIVAKVIEGIKFVAENVGDFISKHSNPNAVDTDPRLIRSQQGIPKFAEGGIVTSPTLAMVGEGGEPEAIIPFSKMGGMGEINYSPVINITGDVSNNRAKEIAKITFDEFKVMFDRYLNEKSRLSFATI